MGEKWVTLDFEPRGRGISRRRVVVSAAAAVGGAILPAAGVLPASGRRSRPGGEGELFDLGIADVARLIEARKVSPVELTQLTLDRIAGLDPHYSSYTTMMAEAALAAARRAESTLGSKGAHGPLHGVPVAVKDLCSTQGVRTMGGTPVLKDNVPDFDATVVSRLAAAGAVLLGKLNLTEGAMAGYHPDFAIPRNPWAPDRWVGGSSSGSGVATAMGLCFGSVGSDTGGSIRYPSAACGIVGLKPTYGRVSRYGVLALAASMDHVGPMTRSSVDAAIMLDAIAGYDPKDPTSSPVPVPQTTRNIDGGIRGMRIGFDETYTFVGLDSHAAGAMQTALEVLKRSGAELVPVEMPKADDAAWWTLCTAEAALAHSAYYPARQAEYGAYFREFLAYGTAVTGVQYAKAHLSRVEFSAQFARLMDPLDCFVCPTVPGVSFRIPPDALHGSIADFAGFWQPGFNRFTERFNLSFSPTLSTPCGFSPEGLPYSIQFVGRHFDEARLCRVGHTYERETDWLTYRPNSKETA